VDVTLILVVCFASITLLVMSVMLGIRDQWLHRRQLADHPAGPPSSEPHLRPLPLSSARPLPRGSAQKIDNWFDRLAIESGVEMAPVTLFLMVVAGGLLVGGPLYVWHGLWHISALGASIGVLAVLGLFLLLRRRRRIAMQNQLPEVMELIAQAVRAGESTDQAIAMVGQSMSRPLGIEFRRAARQLEMGLSMDAAMRSLVRRVPLTEMQIFAATLRMQRKAGGNLPVTLERLVQVVRDRISYVRQFRAATAAGRTSSIVIALAAPLVIAYMAIWKREYIQSLMELPAGQAMFATAIALQLLGIVWVFRLLRTKY